MALQQTIQLPDGLGSLATITNAYLRVEKANVSKTKAKYTLSIYRSNGGLRVHNMYGDCDYDLTGDNPIKQVYLHLKTLPLHAEAQDV